MAAYCKSPCVLSMTCSVIVREHVHEIYDEKLPGKCCDRISHSADRLSQVIQNSLERLNMIPIRFSLTGWICGSLVLQHGALRPTRL